MKQPGRPDPSRTHDDLARTHREPTDLLSGLCVSNMRDHTRRTLPIVQDRIDARGRAGASVL